MKKYARFAASTAVVTAGLGLVGLGAATGAQAHVGPFPNYHWCPGQQWDPGWGNNWEWNACHDDFHRDIDGYNHDRDYRGPAPGDYRGGDHDGGGQGNGGNGGGNGGGGNGGGGGGH